MQDTETERHPQSWKISVFSMHQGIDCAPRFSLNVIRKLSFERFVLANFVLAVTDTLSRNSSGEKRLIGAHVFRGSLFLM